MESIFFDLMGWDPAADKPLPHTLASLGLEQLIAIYGSGHELLFLAMFDEG